MRILIATDAWHPQINGVVRTYQRLSEEVKAFGSELIFVSPDDFRTVPFPMYPEVRLAVPDQGKAQAIIEKLGPDFIHIATEGPVGRMVRRYCLRKDRMFTTSYHTKFPEYLKTLVGVPERWTYDAMRRFHNSGAGIMVATPSLRDDLAKRGFERILPWTRGVDTALFRPRRARLFATEEPVFLYVGRVSQEKNIEAFLRLDLPGKKLVVGDGPHRSALEASYPDVTFTGPKQGEDLACHYASSDCFVFPSRTDTFGLVMLEAMASGVPVAAYPVTGPVDVVADGESGVLDEDLAKAAIAALACNRSKVRAHAQTYSWANAAHSFLSNINTALGGANSSAGLPDTQIHTMITAQKLDSAEKTMATVFTA